MAYAKAGALLEIAMDIAARRYGMSSAEIDKYSHAENADARRRNTQRLVKSLEQVFGTAVETKETAEGKFVFITDSKNLAHLQNVTRDEWTAFDHAIKLLDVNGQSYDAERLQDLRGRIMALAGKNIKNPMLVDYEYLIESNYIAATPGPRAIIDEKTVAEIYEALTTGNQIKFDYFDPIKNEWSLRHVHPQGLIVGRRHYLIAISDKALQFAKPIWYRLDRVRNIEQLQATSVKYKDFNLADYAKRAYGAFYSDEEYQEIEWRFVPEAANAVHNFRFHPDQIVEENSDGSITVRFKAAGWYEMAWALYPWGDKVEVIKPAGLKKMVENYRRNDIPVLP